MSHKDLREWITTLERAGELKRIGVEADPILEVAEIADRVSKSKVPRPGGPALLFEKLTGHPGSKLLINQFGSERRMRMALGVDSLDEVAERIRDVLNMKSPEGFLGKLKMLPMLAAMGKFFPKMAPMGPCKEVIKKDRFSLLDFLILKCWPQDGGRFITLRS
ncbi:MAG TPA: UbiD family decarboxylase, partial [Terriglobales bacterium]|nr:UbiD family decarboxylase [Terriglobales bacterium]